MKWFSKSFLFVGTMVGLICTAPALHAADPFPTYEKAAFYHDHSGQQWNVAYQVLKRYQLPTGGNVLDLGCRTGRTSAHLATRIPQAAVVGADESPGMIDFAQKNFPKDLYGNLTFARITLLKETPKPTYDLITSFSALHWYDDQDVALGRIYDWLRHDGKVLITVPGEKMPAIGQLIEEIAQESSWKAYFAGFIAPKVHLSGEEYRAHMQNIGYRNITIKEVDIKYAFESKRDFIDWFKAYGYYIISRLPDGLQEKFVTDLANRWVKRFPPQADGKIPFIQKEIILQGQR